jgi:hypothetical protein
MDTIKTLDEINQDRRRFFGTAAMAVAATQLGMHEDDCGCECFFAHLKLECEVRSWSKAPSGHLAAAPWGG